MRKSKTIDCIREVWLGYKATGCPELRNQLVENYHGIVKYNSERIGAKLPDEVDVADLVSAGIFGLVDAIESFDMSRGVKFETYCAPRIRGAILDELRAMDWVPRLVRSRAHKLERATQALEVRYGRQPTEKEISNHMSLPREEFQRLMRDAKAVSVVSLSRKQYETDSSREVCEIDILQDKRSSDPVEEAQKRDLKELITRGLSRAERLVLILYYYEQMTMKEIGLTLELSESRVSQMHSSILARLKSQIKRTGASWINEDARFLIAEEWISKS